MTRSGHRLNYPFAVALPHGSLCLTWLPACTHPTYPERATNVLGLKELVRRESKMRVQIPGRNVLGWLLFLPVISLMALPGPSFAQQESTFFLQEHGGVRVLRGVSEGKNFEPVVIVSEDEETEEELAAAPPQAQPEETLPRATPGGGIVTHRAGDQGRGLKRLQQGAIHGNTNLRTHRAGESSRGKIPVHRMGRSDQSNIRTHRMGG